MLTAGNSLGLYGQPLYRRVRNIDQSVKLGGQGDRRPGRFHDHWTLPFEPAPNSNGDVIIFPERAGSRLYARVRIRPPRVVGSPYRRVGRKVVVLVQPTSYDHYESDLISCQQA
jgi:hypothetical protein